MMTICCVATPLLIFAMEASLSPDGTLMAPRTWPCEKSSGERASTITAELFRTCSRISSSVISYRDGDAFVLLGLRLASRGAGSAVSAATRLDVEGDWAEPNSFRLVPAQPVSSKPNGKIDSTYRIV